MDNVVSGCSSVQDALEYYHNVRQLMSNAHFNLRSWASSSPEVRTKAQQDGIADTAVTVNVLGLMWDISQDSLRLADRVFSSLDVAQPTKKGVLQDLSRVFDLLGMLTPVTILAKLFMQQLWQSKLKWDEPLTAQLTTEWKCVFADLKQTSSLYVPRQYLKLDADDQLVLHIFVNASLKAYGAVAFICTRTSSLFVMAKV